MESFVRPEHKHTRVYRKSLRLTFRIAKGEVHLVSFERLGIICPPSIGERPQAGRHNGFWIELRDKENQTLFHRLLHSPLGNSVEVHSPDGKIQRVYGEVSENIFEVLLPDEENAHSVILIGDSLYPARPQKKRTGGSKELSRFEIPKEDKGGVR